MGWDILLYSTCYSNDLYPNAGKFQSVIHSLYLSDICTNNIFIHSNQIKMFQPHTAKAELFYE
jgi:hypothetical protein